MILRIVLTVSLVFSATSSALAEAPAVMPDVVYGHKDGLAMTFDVKQPQDANGVGVVFMVSGGWFSRWFPPERVIREDAVRPNGFEALVARGFTLFLVRHGSAPKYKVPDAVADVRRAVRFIRCNSARFQIDPDRIGVFGGSAGGHLSLMLGTTADDGMPSSPDPVLNASCRVAAVVAQFPPTDLRDLVGPNKRFPALDFAPEMVESVSPLLHVTPDDAPTLLIHGDQDKLVDLSHSQKLVERLAEEEVEHELIVIEGAAHGFRGEHEQRAIAATVEWFEKRLVGKEAKQDSEEPAGKE